MSQKSLRQSLLKSGLSLFHQRGFNATGVLEIAQNASAPKGSFYNHFDSKEAFAIEIIGNYWEAAQPLLAILQDPAIESPLKRIKIHFQKVADTIARRSDFSGCLLCNLAAELSTQSEEVRKKLSGIYSVWTKALANCLKEARKKGELSAGTNVDSVAAFLVNSWQGALIRYKTDRDAAIFDEFEKVAIDQFLGLGS